MGDLIDVMGFQMHFRPRYLTLPRSMPSLSSLWQRLLWPGYAVRNTSLQALVCGCICSDTDPWVHSVID